MPLPSVKGQIRAAKLSMPIGLLILVSGCAAVALGERALGGTLLALSVVCVLSGGIVLVRVKKVVLAAIRSEHDQRLAEVDRIIGFEPEGPDVS